MAACGGPFRYGHAPPAMTLITQLLSRAGAGNAEALAALLESCGPRVRASIRGMIPGRHRALMSEDDVMQQAYTDAFLKIGGLRGTELGEFAAWLRALARCALLDAVRLLEADKRGGGRRAVRAGSDSRAGLLDALGAGGPTASRVAATREAVDALEAALEFLPPVQREVVRLYDLEGKSATRLVPLSGEPRTEVWLHFLRQVRFAAASFLTRTGGPA